VYKDRFSLKVVLRTNLTIFFVAVKNFKTLSVPLHAKRAVYCMIILSNILEISIPNQLESRSHDYSYYVIGALFVGLILLSFARLVRPNIYSNLFISATKIGGLRSFVKDALPLNKRGSILLLMNYAISSTAVMVMWHQVDPVDYEWPDLILIGVPVLTFVFNYLSMEFTTWLTGDRDAFTEPKMIKLIGSEMNGIFFFLIALVWGLNDSLATSLWLAAVWIFFIEMAFRIFKSILIVSAKGISWYYIILYLCTLEILPLFIAYYVLVV